MFETPGKKLVPREFTDLCTQMRVEASVSATPNPGDPFNAMRLIRLRNFNNEPIRITQYNRRNTVTTIPAQGAGDIMLAPGEDMLNIEKGI